MVDAATFAKELNKYKIVRSEDFCRSHEKQRNAVVIAKTAAPSTTAASTAVAKDKVNTVKKETNITNRVSVSFWTTFENALAENNALSTREITNLINTMRKCEREFVRSVNLDDLETAATSIQSKN